MNSKVILLSFAVVAVGLFALPSTLSLFAGQHTFYGGDDVRCAKCHQDIYDQLQQNNFHVWTNSTGNLVDPNIALVDPTVPDNTGSGPCLGCHRVPGGINVTSQPYAYNNLTLTEEGLNVNNTHTMVATLECVTCHTAAGDYLNGVNTGGQIDVHQKYYQDALSAGKSGTGDIPLKGANAACVGCHTHTVVTLNWTRSTGYNANITEDTTGNYTMQFSMNTTATQTNITSGQ